MNREWLKKNLAALLLGEIKGTELEEALELLKQNPDLAQEYKQMQQIYEIRQNMESVTPEPSEFLSSRIMAQIRELPSAKRTRFSDFINWKNLFLIPSSAFGILSAIALIYSYFNLPAEYQVCMPSSSFWESFRELDISKLSSNTIQALLFILGGGLIAKSWQSRNTLLKIASILLLFSLILMAALGSI